MNLTGKMLSFDIETAEEIDFKNQQAKIPISIASTVMWNVSCAGQGTDETLWYSNNGKADETRSCGFNPGDMPSNAKQGLTPAPEMTPADAAHLLRFLKERQNDGFQVFAWNGAGFDLRVIGQVAEDLWLAGEITMDLYDPMFQMLSKLGYPVGLAAVGKGMGIEQEKLMDGADAPQAWRDGEFQKVEDYVLGDSQITSQIVLKIAQEGSILWESKKGKAMRMPIDKFMTVRECMATPARDNSWMDEPLRREDILSWIPNEILLGGSEFGKILGIGE